MALANELGNVERSALCRQQAGLQLKNALTSKDDAVADEKAAMWRSFDSKLRAHIKQAVSAPFASPCSFRYISTYACYERRQL